MATTTTTMPLPKQQFLSSIGTPLVGGKIYTYAAGTSDPKPTYSDIAGTIAQANPIQLNVRGEPATPIYWSGNYRVEVRDSLGNLIYSVDNFNTDPADVWNLMQHVSDAFSLPTGASKTGFQPSGNGAVATTVEAALQQTTRIQNFPAQADVGGNQAPYFNNALAEAKAKKQAALAIPLGNWRLTDEITLTGVTTLRGESGVGSILTLEGAGAYGINVAGLGLGGSGTDGIEVGPLNLWGGKDTALLRMNGTGLFRIHDITAQNNSKGNVVRFTNCQDGCFDRFDFLQCGGAYPYSPADGAVVYYGPGCNNIYTRYGRFEAPRNTAIYVDGADTIRYIGGKIDGSYGGDSLTRNPFVVCKNGSIIFRDHTVTGFLSYPFSVEGYGTIDYSGVIGNGQAPALFTASPAYDLFLLSGGRPGVIRKPSIKFRGRVGFSSENTAANIIGAIISYKAASPLLKPNAGNSGKVQITGAADTGGGLFQGSITEWNGAAYVAPANNDRYAGAWLVDLTTGNAWAQIVSQVGGLVQYRTNGLANTGPEYFVQYDNVHGVRLDIQIDAPAYSGSRWSTRMAELLTTVTVTAVNYGGGGNTTVQLNAPVANDTLIGYFLRDQVNDAYYYISANAGAQLFVMHNRAAALPNGTYEIVKGNPKAGNGITINWQ